jgi:glycosyltransferase involved in cell wall biosynthesis
MSAKKAPHLLIFAPSARTGGPLRYLEQGIPRLVRRWPGPVSVALPRESAIHVRIPPGRAQILLLDRRPWARGPTHVVHTQALAVKISRTLNPDVVLSLGNLSYHGPRRRTVTLFQNAALVRDLRRPSLRSVAYVAARRVLVLLSVMRSTQVVAASHHTQSVLPLGAGRSRSTVIYHGFELPRQGVPQPDVNRDSSDRPVLTVGGLSPYRGLETLIIALSQQQLASWRVRVVGPGSDRRYVRYCTHLAQRHGVASRLTWEGPLAHVEVLQRMATCRAVVLTSRAESCPNTLLEAAAVSPARPIVGLRYAWSDEYDPLFDVRCAPEDLGRVLAELPQRSPPEVVARRRAWLANISWEDSMDRMQDVLLQASKRQSWPTV